MLWHVITWLARHLELIKRNKPPPYTLAWFHISDMSKGSKLFQVTLLGTDSKLFSTVKEVTLGWEWRRNEAFRFWSLTLITLCSPGKVLITTTAENKNKSPLTTPEEEKSLHSQLITIQALLELAYDTYGFGHCQSPALCCTLGPLTGLPRGPPRGPPRINPPRSPPLPIILGMGPEIWKCIKLVSHCWILARQSYHTGKCT